MPTLSFTLSAAAIAELTDAMCALHGYPSTIPDVNGNQIPNPETRAQFARRMGIEHFRREVMKYRSNLATDAVIKTPPDIT